MQTIHILLQRSDIGLVFKPCHMNRLPAEFALVAQNITRPEGITALQGNGVIEYMKNFHSVVICCCSFCLLLLDCRAFGSQ